MIVVDAKAITNGVFWAVASPGFVARRGKAGKYRSWGIHGELRGWVQQLLNE